MKTLIQKDFEEFKKDCRYYVQKFNLKDWDIFYEFKNMKRLSASCIRDVNTHMATITLATRIEDDHVIKELAKHECIHLLIGVLSDFATTRYLTSREVNTEEERLVVLLEKLL